MATIAVIDDDQTLLDLMAELLDEHGSTILPLQDSSEIIDPIRQTRPDAIILDVRLSGTRTGWDILEQLQADPRTASIPVIMWSGDPYLLGEKREWLDNFDVRTLAKPFEIDDFYATLNAVLNSRQGSFQEQLQAAG